MEFYDFNKDVYNKIVEIVKFQFYKEIKDTGIVFKEILSANNLVKNISFYILEYEIDFEIKYLRFKDSKSFAFQLENIARRRLQKLEKEERMLLKVTDTESYGESKYFDDAEINAINLSSIRKLIELLKRRNNKTSA